MRANTTGQLVSRLRPAAALASRQQPRLREAGGAGDSHPTYYRDHVEHRVIGGIMRDLLAAHQVKLEIQELEYDARIAARWSAISGSTA
ncbi:hypothetical protein KPZU09_40370 [Klebsiella pneumoniae]|uniref:Uncharacterized protein n=1 Tax=Klebsiella pneumoniae TaxID=573 RepID=A0A919I218_KLEPN|nr:hypothetical protein KPZU09_40370 [Klebsiella pneumoniae]